MKLTQVEIENFRCFERLALVLEADVTAVIGANAAGKTALLDAIAVGLLPLFEATGLALKLGKVQDLMRKPEITGAAFGLSDSYLGRGIRKNLLFPMVSARALAQGALRQGEDRQFHWTLGPSPVATFRPDKPKWLKRKGLEATSEGLRIAEAGQHHTAFNIPAFAYYRDSRNCRGPRQSRSRARQALHQEAAYLHALDAGAAFDAAQHWFYTRENQELRTAREKQDTAFQFPDLKAIREALNLMLDGLGRVYADDDPPRMKVQRKEPNGETVTLEFSQLSAGQRNLLALTLDFARRLVLAHPDHPEPLTAPGILLIDEIELNLHPKWQQTVIPRLRRVFPNTQLIVATHSPLVLSTLEKRQIRVLRDQQIFTPSVETYGTDTGRVQRLVMDTDTRPPNNPVTERMHRLFARIADGELEEAERLLAELAADRDPDDPALLEARTLIDNRKWEQELGL